MRVLLGRYGLVQSPIPAPSDLAYLAVRLRAGESWSYSPPAGHDVAWFAMDSGQIHASASIGAGETVIFYESSHAIDLVAVQPSIFVLGSAVRYPYELVTGHYSVHTNPLALEQGEAEIRRIGAELQRKRPRRSGA